MTDPRSIQVQAGPASALAAQQARFQALVHEVALWRAALAQWDERLARHELAIEPVRRELHAAWREWVFALDAASLQAGLARAESAQLGELLREAAQALLDAEGDDAEIAAVLNRHEPAAARQAAGGSAEGAAAAEPAAAQDWEALAAAAAAQRQQRAEQRRAASAGKRREQATQEATQSVRDVYRRLASALHPDREPDAGRRRHKTALMQQANQAHADGNLLTLLELQAEAQQAEAAQAAALEPRRLQHYISVLQQQLEQLQAQTRRREAAFRAATGAGPGSGLQPRKADRLISSQAQALRCEVALLRRQARLLRDVEATKEWLRAQRKA